MRTVVLYAGDSEDLCNPRGCTDCGRIKKPKRFGGQVFKWRWRRSFVQPGLIISLRRQFINFLYFHRSSHFHQKYSFAPSFSTAASSTLIGHWLCRFSDPSLLTWSSFASSKRILMFKIFTNVNINIHLLCGFEISRHLNTYFDDTQETSYRLMCTWIFYAFDRSKRCNLGDNLSAEINYFSWIAPVIIDGSE